MKASQKCVDFIKEKEGLELEAYPDPGTGGAPWTIGYGHTGPEVVKGLVITQAKADKYLADDLAKFELMLTQNAAAAGVLITQGQFDGLLSFLYNVGPGAPDRGARRGKDGLFKLRNGNPSTLWRKTIAGDKAGAAEQFGAWNKAAGKVLAGLTTRRAAEKTMYLS